jgi:hypothetical protein
MAILVMSLSLLLERRGATSIDPREHNSADRSL